MPPEAIMAARAQISNSPMRPASGGGVCTLSSVTRPSTAMVPTMNTSLWAKLISLRTPYTMV